MSLTLDITERQLTLAVVKIAAVLTSSVAFIAFVISLAAGAGLNIAVGCVLVSGAFLMLTNGALALTRVVDWLEARRERKHG